MNTNTNANTTTVRVRFPAYQKVAIIATVILAILKMTGIANIGWLLVFSPIVAVFVFSFVLFLVRGCGASVAGSPLTSPHHS